MNLTEPERVTSEFPKEIAFFSGKPSGEVTKGVIHLYKKNERKEIKEGPSNQLCLLAVPANLCCYDLVNFLVPWQSEIQHIRIVRDGSPNQFMVLLKFRSNESALEFYQNFNGAAYNSLEPDSMCHAVWVSDVQRGDNGVPPLGHTELPTCPVCLERMDESVDGIVTALCNHAIHAKCLAKCGDSTCPVCRNVQTPELEENFGCMECEDTEAVWICLDCGHVGCAHYKAGHAMAHFRTTNHTFVMELRTCRVWDYAGKIFVSLLLFEADWRDFKKTAQIANIKLNTLKLKVQTLSKKTEAQASRARISELVENFRCMDCEVMEAVWICLACGYVGCAYYKAGHSAAHFRSTNHTFVMDLRTCRVWDNAGKKFLRLLQFEVGWRIFKETAQKVYLKLNTLKQKVQTLAKEKQAQANRAQISQRVGNFKCMECGDTVTLWICLFCGHVGCGPYRAGHALAHFRATNHTFAMELRACSAWNFAKIKYIHPLNLEAGWHDFIKTAHEANLKLKTLRQKVEALPKRKHAQASHTQISEIPQNSICMTCEGMIQLWICLSCGHVGCGRYKAGHALAHFRATNHIYVMELRKCRVWSYADQIFVSLLNFEASWRDFNKTAEDAILKLKTLNQKCKLC